MRPQMLIMSSGALLILCGVAMVAYQGYSEITSQQSGVQEQQQQQSASIAPGQISVKTRFPGIELVAIGALLQIVGYLGTQPWKGSSPPQGDKA
jgi:hypothetical protein